MQPISGFAVGSKSGLGSEFGPNLVFMRWIMLLSEGSWCDARRNITFITERCTRNLCIMNMNVTDGLYDEWMDTSPERMVTGDILWMNGIRSGKVWVYMNCLGNGKFYSLFWLYWLRAFLWCWMHIVARTWLIARYMRAAKLSELMVGACLVGGYVVIQVLLLMNFFTSCFVLIWLNM